MSHHDRLRSDIHAVLDQMVEPIPDLTPAAMRRIRASARPSRYWLRGIQAVAVLLLAALVGGMVVASHQLLAARQQTQHSRPSTAASTVATPNVVDPANCRLPVLLSLEAGPPSPVYQNEAGFVDTRTGRYVADATASVAGLPGGGSPGTNIKPAFPASPTSYDAALGRWLPVDRASVSPDGRSYVWVRLLPIGSNYSTFRSSELHRFDIVARLDRTLWTYQGEIDVGRWDKAGILVATLPPAGGVQTWWLIDPSTGSRSQQPPSVAPSRRLTELPGDRINGGFSYGVIGADAEGRPIYRIGSQRKGDREWVFYESAPGQRVTIYQGQQDDATGFDPIEALGDSTGLWFGDYDSRTIWHWSFTVGLRKIDLGGVPPAIAGHSLSYVFVSPVGPCG